jgi:hypothetical protein
MSKIPDLSTIPASVIKDQLSRILLAIPEGAGQELFEFEKEIRRERCDISAENGLKTI